ERAGDPPAQPARGEYGGAGARGHGVRAAVQLAVLDDDRYEAGNGDRRRVLGAFVSLEAAGEPAGRRDHEDGRRASLEQAHSSPGTGGNAGRRATKGPDCPEIQTDDTMRK